MGNLALSFRRRDYSSILHIEVASTGPRQQMFRIYKWSGAQGVWGLSQLREMGTKLNA